MLRFMPLPTGEAVAVHQPLEESLWRSTGMVRQSIVDLYRIQRSQQRQAAAPIASADTPAETPEQVSQPMETRPANANVIDNALEMRVAIARNVPALTVGSNTSGWVMNTDGSAHCDIAAQSSLRAVPNAQGINFSGCQLSGAVWLEADTNGLVYVGDSWYRGRVLLFNDGGSY